jgi:Cys-tRNA(Pro)/Cys-tRNA(Cys) deacylase
VVALPKGLGVAVLPVPSKLSLKAAAAALGVAKATMAERVDAERSTGYVLGGISPLGQRKPLPTVVDASALRWDRVLCSAGKRGWDVALHPQDLIRLTNAVTADIRA